MGYKINRKLVWKKEGYWGLNQNHNYYEYMGYISVVPKEVPWFPLTMRIPIFIDMDEGISFDAQALLFEWR